MRYGHPGSVDLGHQLPDDQEARVAALMAARYVLGQDAPVDDLVVLADYICADRVAPALQYAHDRTEIVHAAASTSGDAMRWTPEVRSSKGAGA